MTSPTDDDPAPRKKGFAAMDKDRLREICRRGGAGIPAEKRAFSKDRALARTAGAKGGATARKDKPS